MEISVRRTFSSVIWELKSLTLDIHSHAIIKGPKIKNLHAFVMSLVRHTRTMVIRPAVDLYMDDEVVDIHSSRDTMVKADQIV